MPLSHLVKLLSITAFLSVAIFSHAQNKWSIGNCIDYALEHNLDLNMKFNEVETNEVNLKESKARIYPNLNINSNLDYNFGRAIDGDNNVTFDASFTNNYWATTNFTIFQGMVKRNNIRYQKYMLTAKLEEVEIEKNALVTRILSSYYTVLYSKGLADVAQSQLDLSRQQYERMNKLVEVGKESPLAAQDLKSQMAEDQLALTKAENQLNKTLLELKQLLRLDATKQFEIDSLDLQDLALIPDFQVEEVFLKAKEVLPQLKQQDMLLQASERELKMVKGYVYPSLGLSAGYSTVFYSNSSLNYVQQLENNQNQYVAASLRMPIFNHSEISSRIKRQKIALKTQKLQFEKQKEALYIEIWNAIEDLESAEKEYKSSEELYDFSELNLKNVTKKLEKGLANTTEFETAKQRYVSSQANLLKAKMIYIMRKDMLIFYQTADWGHLY